MFDKSEDACELLKYANNMILASFGLPPGMIIPEKGKTNLDVIFPRDVDRTIKGIQNEISEEYQRNLIPDILKSSGLSGAKPPQIKWRESIPVDLNRKAKRISTYVKFGILEPNDIRPIILKDEGITGVPERIVADNVTNKPISDPTRGVDSVKGRDKSLEKWYSK